MQSHRIRRFVAATLGAAVLTGGAAAAFAEPAEAQTREHILLARQLPVPLVPSGVSVELSVGTGPTPTASTDGQPCSDWTNPDGTHGTNCPAPSGGGGGRGSSAVVSLGKLGRVE